MNFLPILLTLAVINAQSICPQFTYESHLGYNYAISLPSDMFSYEEASSICGCVSGTLANIPNSLIQDTQNSNIHGSFWIKSYDGGDLVPYLVWTREVVNSIAVKDSGKAQVICEVERMNLNRSAIALLEDVETGISGEVLFQLQNNGVKVTGYFNSLLPEVTYYLNIMKFGDVRNPPFSLGSVFNPEKRSSNLNGEMMNMRIVAQRGRTASFEYIDDRLSLYGVTSIIGRGLALFQTTPVKSQSTQDIDQQLDTTEPQTNENLTVMSEPSQTNTTSEDGQTQNNQEDIEQDIEPSTSQELTEQQTSEVNNPQTNSQNDEAQAPEYYEQEDLSKYTIEKRSVQQDNYVVSAVIGLI